MYLQEIFDQLSGGEFSQLSVGGADSGVIDGTNAGRVLGHINLGLTTLFTRFNLKQRTLKFPLQAGSDTYSLNIDDILKITKVVTDLEVELALNREGDCYSCFTPSLKVLRVPEVIVNQGPDLPDEFKTASLSVVYRANHPKLKPQGLFSGVNQEVELPATHLLPLLYFVASRVHNPIGMSNEFHAGNSYYAKYEAACKELEHHGMQVDKDVFNDRLYRNGWV